MLQKNAIRVFLRLFDKVVIENMGPSGRKSILEMAESYTNANC